MIFNHISLGQVIVTKIYWLKRKAVIRTIADNIQYKINLIDCLDY